MALVLLKDPVFTARCEIVAVYRQLPPAVTGLELYDCFVSPRVFKTGDVVKIGFKWRVKPSGAVTPSGATLKTSVYFRIWTRRGVVERKVVERTFGVGGRSGGSITLDVKVPDFRLPPGNYMCRVVIIGELRW